MYDKSRKGEAWTTGEVKRLEEVLDSKPRLSFDDYRALARELKRSAGGVQSRMAMIRRERESHGTVGDMGTTGKGEKGEA